MANLAIIPARGGSKRIPKKNIKGFKGQPMIAYSIKAALNCGLFDEVMVSTDDDEIALVAEQNNATVPFRRSKLNANDHATLSDVLLEVIESYKKIGKDYDTICCILPTAALVTEKRIKEAFRMLQEQAYYSVVPVIKFSYPIQRALKDVNGNLQMREPQYLKTRSQDLESNYYDSGQFYWIRKEKLIEEQTLFTSKTGYIELDEMEAQDVDTLQDWQMLEFKHDYLKGNK